MASIKTVQVPDLGGASDVEVIEVQVSVGDIIRVEDALITLEGDKATMEIPSPYAGKVESLNIAVGDKVSTGSPILTLALEDQSSEPTQEEASCADAESRPVADVTADQSDESNQQLDKGRLEKKVDISMPGDVAALGKVGPGAPKTGPVSQTQVEAVSDRAIDKTVYAGPSVRRLARELGIDLSRIRGTGEKGRVSKTDVLHYLRQETGLPTASLPAIDFAAFGPIDHQPLNRTKSQSGKHLHRSWITAPHVTQFQEADITELESFRQSNKAKANHQGIKLTLLAFIMKATVTVLKRFPSFNASLNEAGDGLILKHYYHIGFAVDTPLGLLVPVVRDVDKKGVFEIASELADISQKAREKTLPIAAMQGGTFTVSSLGGIGGGVFTPIINVPEVAILGVAKAVMKPMYDIKQPAVWLPRLMLPLCLSYDHRVIDGAEGARFLVDLSSALSDIRTLLL